MDLLSMLQLGVMAWGLGTAGADAAGTAQTAAEATARAADVRFQVLDVNHDGVISRYEYDSEIVFDMADANHDGILTEKELEAALPPRTPDVPALARRMLVADLDRDGGLDDGELRRAVEQRFDWLDRNHDGNLDPGEFTAGYGVRVRP